MHTPQNHTTLFAAPKQGGIVQSSGFLDLKSLVALGRTCKSNALDELSLIPLIENEMEVLCCIMLHVQATSNR